MSTALSRHLRDARRAVHHGVAMRTLFRSFGSRDPRLLEATRLDPCLGTSGTGYLRESSSFGAFRACSYRDRLVSGDRTGLLMHLTGFLLNSNSSSLIGSHSNLYKGHVCFSTSASNLKAAKPAEATVKHLQNNTAKKESQDIPDIKILRTLGKYLWLKDNAEFRLRVIFALGLLVGAKKIHFGLSHITSRFELPMLTPVRTMRWPPE